MKIERITKKTLLAVIKDEKLSIRFEDKAMAIREPGVIGICKTAAGNHMVYGHKLPINTMHVHINDLKTRQEVLGWYIEMNAGGTPHSKKEIARVQSLLDACM